MANETWNEAGRGSARPGWHPGIGDGSDRGEARVDVDYTDQDLGAREGGARTGPSDYGDVGYVDRGYGAQGGLGDRGTGGTLGYDAPAGSSEVRVGGAVRGRGDEAFPERVGQRMAREDQLRIRQSRGRQGRPALSEERRIKYENAGLRKMEWEDRRAAYDREAERRHLMQREHNRETGDGRDTGEEHRRSAKIELHPRRRTDIHHSVREESTGTLVRDFITEAQFLARQEMELAKQELRDEAKSAGKTAAAAGTGLGAGAALAFVGLLVLTFAVVFALGALMPLWLSALLVGAVVLLVGGILAMGGISKLKSLQAPKPDETTETLKEDREWASDMMRDVKSRRRGHA